MNKSVAKEYLIILAGMSAAAVGIYFFQLPAGIVLGSITGLGMILVKLIPISLSLMVLILNVICLAIGFLLIGKEFGVKTVFASMIFPVLLFVFEHIFPNQTSLTGELVLDGIIAMLILSVGQAILFQTNACTGGSDILAKVLNQFFHVELGNAVTILGMIIVMSSILVYDLKTVIISLFFTYVNGRIVDEFISGFSRKKRVCVISAQADVLRTYILQEIKRGVSVYTVTGGYSNQKREELVTVLNKNEYFLLMKKIREVDPAAFVTVSSVSEVAGMWNEKQ